MDYCRVAGKCGGFWAGKQFVNNNTYNVTLRATIKNRGNASAGASITAFGASPSFISIIQNVNTPGLASGQSANVTTYGVAGLGNYTISAVADNNNNVLESDEYNNLRITSLLVP